MEIFQIVSRLPPAIDGVGDYAFLLAKQLRKAHGINTQFIVCDTEWGHAETLKPEKLKSDSRPPTSDLRPPALLDGFPVHQLKERSAEEFLRVLSLPGMPSTVLLQYVGYGYEKRGCPVWLVRALRAWQRSEVRSQKSEVRTDIRPLVSGLSARPRLITMFHELYAFGLPWRSSFWASPVQRWIAKSLAQLSGHCITNRVASARWLASANERSIETIPVLPVFSNLGETESISPLALRKPQMLIYGGLSRSPNDRDLAIKSIHHASKRLGIERLITFGSKTVDSTSMGLPVKAVGKITGNDASKLLSESRAGYLDYFDGYLAKSGIFASYCAYGLVPFLLRRNGSDADGVEMNKHFLATSVLPEETGVETQQRIADQAHGWYCEHSVKETSSIFANKLKPVADHVDFSVEK